MSDPAKLLEELEAAEDAFGHVDGKPTFESGLTASPDARPGEVQIQKACRLLEITGTEAVADYYGAILEHAFIAIEHTFQGYLLAFSGFESRELRNHVTPFECAKGRVPLEDSTIESIQRLYDERRTEHYYGTSVTTRSQAERMRNVAGEVHRHVIGYDAALERFCRCSS